MAGPDYTLERAKMVRTIESHAREAGLALRGDQIDPKVLEVLRAVPRHEFVPEGIRETSYADHPLPIGYGQTISQPFIVALMTDVLDAGPNGVVLEVGTGSGYQAAVLAQLVRQVYTVELIPALAGSAADRLSRLGYANVSVRQGDGYNGLQEAAPFDGIIVTAAAGHIPPPLLQQLKPGGRMVIPVGPPFGLQHLTVVERDPEGRVRTRQLFPVRFVPLIGQH
jgi:protein-L-isoaspartate(D-aspartate) O-methyltransferase